MEGPGVELRIRGRQRNETGEILTSETLSSAKSYRRGDKRFFLYEDKDLLPGHCIASQLKISPQEVTLYRKPPLDQKLSFIPGEETFTRYRTPCGDVELSIYTDFLKVSEGSAEIAYDLKINGNWQSRNELSIEINGIEIKG